MIFMTTANCDLKLRRHFVLMKASPQRIWRGSPLKWAPCDIINIKPTRVSGWTEARRIHDLGREAGIDLWVGGMLETGVGRAAQLALAALPGFTLPWRYIGHGAILRS